MRDKGTIAGTLSVELNDLCFELTDEEREAIGGRVQTSDTPPSASTDPRESGGEGTSGGGQQVAVSGLTNQMEGLNLNAERSPERPSSSSPNDQETQQQQQQQTEAAAVVGTAGLLKAATRVTSHSPTSPPAPTVSVCV